MKVLILGASGFIGQVLAKRLVDAGHDVRCASRGRKPVPDGTAHVALDSRDAEALGRAVAGMDAVINAVAGDAQSIAEGARALTAAARANGTPRIVHLSTMSVYGRFEGVANESTPFDPDLGWYAAAKCEAERIMDQYADAGGAVVSLRPGCVYGPGSELWVGRIGRWLKAGRLGDLGAAGDGWTNLVHVDDVCRAIAAGLTKPVAPGKSQAFNLASPDGPRWNTYFVDLARGIGAIPVRRISSRQLKLDANAFGPPLKIAEKIMLRAGARNPFPDALPPALVRFFDQHVRLDAQRAKRELDLTWTPYETGLAQSTAWFMQTQS